MTTTIDLKQPFRFMDKLFDEIKYHFESAVMLAQIGVTALLGDAIMIFICCFLSIITALYVYKKGYFVDKEKRKLDIAKAIFENKILEFEAEKRKYEAQKAKQEAALSNYDNFDWVEQKFITPPNEANP